MAISRHARSFNSYYRISTGVGTVTFKKEPAYIVQGETETLAGSVAVSVALLQVNTRLATLHVPSRVLKEIGNAVTDVVLVGCTSNGKFTAPSESESQLDTNEGVLL